MGGTPPLATPPIRSTIRLNYNVRTRGGAMCTTYCKAKSESIAIKQAISQENKTPNIGSARGGERRSRSSPLRGLSKSPTDSARCVARPRLSSIVRLKKDTVSWSTFQSVPASMVARATAHHWAGAAKWFMAAVYVRSREFSPWHRCWEKDD